YSIVTAADASAPSPDEPSANETTSAETFHSSALNSVSPGTAIRQLSTSLSPARSGADIRSTPSSPAISGGSMMNSPPSAAVSVRASKSSSAPKPPADFEAL